MISVPQNPNGPATVANSQPVNIASDQAPIQDISSTGNINGTNSVSINTNGYGTVGFQVSGTWVGSITVEASVDGTNFIPTSFVALSSGGVATNFSVNTIGQVNCAGLRVIRLRGNTVSSGSAVVTMYANTNVSNVMLDNPLPAGGNVVGKLGIDQSTPGTTNRVNIGTDGVVGTNSTVFVFSPNNVNSTTSNLASGATFTGQIESITNQQSFSVLFFADQNATITINQFIDAGGARLCQQNIFNYTANGRFARSFPANGNFAQVIVQNTGGSATTSLQLDTAYGTIPSSTQLGNSPSALNEINGTAVATNTGNADAGTQRVVLASNQPLVPVTTQDVVTSGNITTQNLNPNSGVATAGSTVTLTSLVGRGTVSIQVSGTYTGALTAQATIDGNNWVAVNALQNISTSILSTNIPSGSTGIWQVDAAGFAQFRISANSAVTGTAVISLEATAVNGMVGIDNPTGIQPAANSLAVVAAQQNIFRTTFAAVIASGVDTSFFNLLVIGAGQTVAQSGGNLVLTTGTTVNSETIIRSNQSFTRSFLLRAQTILSQRIVNNNFFIEMVDVIGDNLAITVNSATSVTVTIPNNTFTSANVGQSIYIGNPTGFTGVTAIPGRYAIASVSGNNVTFTVAGWATGSVNTGTCSLFGWNYHQLLYTGATATNVSYDTQRRGWNSGFTNATINTTASPGHMAIMGSEDGNAFLADQLVASATAIPTTVRATRVVNIAEETTPLFLQIRSLNGSTAPASTTTWTIGMISVETYAPQPVAITNSKAQGLNTPQPVQVLNTATVTATNLSTNISQIGGTASVNGGLAGTLAIGGGAAHSAASNTNPAQVGGRVVPTTIATVDTTLVASDISYLPVTSGLQTVTKNFGTSELDINVAVTPSVTTTTIQGLVAASGTASVRNYITQLNIQSDAITTAGSMFILDNQGAIGTSVTIATPGVFTSSAHDLKIGDTIIFTSLGTITGVTVNTLYYITAANFAATTFSVATTPGGAAIAITGATSAFTFYRVLQLIRLQTTALASPVIITPPNPLRGIANANLNVYFPVSLGGGAVYINVIGYRGF